MMKLLASAMLAALLCVPGAANAQQVNKPYSKVGQWTVETIYNQKSFMACRASINTPKGLIGVLQYAGGGWRLSFPDLNVKPGTKMNGMLEIGRASQPVSMTAGRAGMRENVSLAGNVREALAQGGRIMLTMGGRSWDWYMNDAGLAMGAVSDCVSAARKSGGVLERQPAKSNVKTAYQGCYVDKPERTLPVTLIARNATLQSCAEAGKRSGNSYIGLQYGGQCYGGKQPAYQRTLEGECNMRCNANAGQLCGGFWRNSVWRVE